MEKIKVSKSLGTALNEALEIYSSREEAKKLVFEHTLKGTWAEGRSILHDVDAFELAEMLIKDYEIQETPEEKIKSAFDKLKKEDKYLGQVYMSGMRFVLKQLGLSDMEL